MRVELLWWAGCPSNPKALERFTQEARISAVIVREVRSDGQAEDEGFVGSPTIRIDGADVQPPEDPAAGLTCRIYRRRDGRISPTPDPADLRDALSAALSTTSERS